MAAKRLGAGELRSVVTVVVNLCPPTLSVTCSRYGGMRPMRMRPCAASHLLVVAEDLVDALLLLEKEPLLRFQLLSLVPQVLLLPLQRCDELVQNSGEGADTGLELERDRFESRLGRGGRSLPRRMGRKRRGRRRRARRMLLPRLALC